MKARFTSVEKLSTGRHFLAFQADPPSSCLLSPTSVLVLQLVSQLQDETAAREKFETLCRNKIPDPAKVFDQQSSALQAIGFLEK